MEIFATLEEHVGLFEDIQGNVNTAGLVWEHDVDDTLDITHEVYVVWVDEIAETIAFTPTYDAQHLMVIEESLLLQEIIGGVPIEVYHANINVVHSREAAPVRVWWFGLNVVHGPDSYFEEVIDQLHTRVTYTQAIPYYWETVYESIDFEFHNIYPHPGIHLARKIPVFDFVNMRHDVWQWYYFNSSVLEKIFAYDTQKWGWKHDVPDTVAAADGVAEIIGKLADEHIKFRTELESAWKGMNVVDDRIFGWDTAFDVRGWTLSLEDAVTSADAVDVYLNLLIQDLLIAQEIVTGNGILKDLIPEQIAIAANFVNAFNVVIEDGFNAEDVLLHRWLCRALVEEQATFTIQAEQPNQIHDVQLTVTMSLADGN